LAIIKIPVERCIHRHTRFTHPQCWEKTGQHWILKPRTKQKKEGNWYDDLKMGFLDIEFYPSFNADDSYILCWAIKERGGKTQTDVINKKEIFNLSLDRRVVGSLVKAMQEYDVLVTYYGTLCDNPFIRTRSFVWGIDFPKWKELLHIDMYFKCKKLFKLSRTSLANTTKLLGIEGKTTLDFTYWRKAGLGEPKSLKVLLEHNRGDVEILEQQFERLRDFCKFEKRGL
jgi:uncharacterized protein YprB with RNaseH-like and TPR domain